MLSELAAQPRCGVAVSLEGERVQAGARRSGGGSLHNFGQIMRRLSGVDVMHESAELVGNSVTNWYQCSWMRHGDTCSRSPRLKISHAAVFYTCCNGSIVDCGRAARTELQ